MKVKFDNEGRIVNVKELECERIKDAEKHGLHLDLSNPKTIQDKLSWLNIHDCTNLKTKCADKLRVREYCVEKLGKDICVPIIKSYSSVNEINWDELPNKFVIKCNHGFNMNIIVKDKSKLNKEECKESLNEWLKKDFAIAGLEFHYLNIDRKILVEELLEDENQIESLYDYKFWCFNGEPKLYTINNGHGHGDIMYYDVNTDEERDLYGVKSKIENLNFKKPKTFDTMVDYAKKLSSSFRFVRVDFYEVNGRVYLGELTFTPGACNFKYNDPKDNFKIGSFLDLNKIQDNTEHAKNDVTFIIPNRGGNRIPIVIENFRKTFKDYFDDVKFIIVNQEDNTTFKRGQLFNIGSNYVTTKWLGLIDNDIVNIDKFNPVDVYNTFGSHPYVAFDKISQVSIDGDKMKILDTREILVGFGAFNFMLKSDFVKCNGFSNLCFGWGCEDDIINFKLNFKRYLHTLGHITHKVRAYDAEDLLKSNREVLKDYKNNLINPKLDGRKQTIYDIVSLEYADNITKISVRNIDVSNTFEYKNRINAIKKIEKKYIKSDDGVSICVTAYKATKYIKECIESIVSQTWFYNHDNWELLIGIDGCEETYEYVKSFINDCGTRNIRVLYMKTNKGTYITTNTLMSEAKYNRLIRFDSDDLMTPTFIEETVNEVKDGVDYLRYSCRTFGCDKEYTGVVYGCAMIKKNIFEKYGGYQPWKVAADYELCERIQKHVNAVKSDITYLRRLHGDDSLQNSKETGMKSELRKKYHEYIQNESPKHPIIECITNSFDEYAVRPKTIIRRVRFSVQKSNNYSSINKKLVARRNIRKKNNKHRNVNSIDILLIYPQCD